MGFLYAILWFAIGLVLLFSLSKENKIFYFAGGFFVLLGAWWLVDAIFPDLAVFEGWAGTALRIVTLVALVVLSVVFFIERQRTLKEEAIREKMENPPKDDELGN